LAAVLFNLVSEQTLSTGELNKYSGHYAHANISAAVC